jgi:hypothetical protein
MMLSAYTAEGKPFAKTHLEYLLHFTAASKEADIAPRLKLGETENFSRQSMTCQTGKLMMTDLSP